MLAKINASDVPLLVTFVHANDGVLQKNPKGRRNPKALAQLDGYKRPLVSSLSGKSSAIWDGETYESEMTAGNLSKR